jgi:hypothetical protein
MAYGICRLRCRGLRLSSDHIFSKGSTSGCSLRPALIYEEQQRFDYQVANQMALDLVKECEIVGMVTQNELNIHPPSPGHYHRNIHQPSANAYSMGVKTRQYRSGLPSFSWTVFADA